MQKESIEIEVIDRFFSGNYSPEDEDYVIRTFGENRYEEELKSLLEIHFDKVDIDDAHNKKDLQHLLYRLNYEINTRFSDARIRKVNKFIIWSLRIAAIIVLPLLAILGFYTINKTKNLQNKTWTEIKAPAWTRVQFGLPDGSTGWLSSNSSIKYFGNFVTERSLILKGEAFFDIAKDSKRPFIVNTDEVSLSVLGTRFNVASYENENTIEIVLEEGKLVFYDKNKTISYSMNPNDLVVYNKELKSYSTEVVQPSKYLAWTEGKLVFRNDPLDVIARRLERWYDIEVVIQGNLNEDLRLRATFVDEDLFEVLSLLERSLPITHKIENGSIQSNDIYEHRKVIIITDQQ